MTVTIRPAQPVDAAGILAVVRDAFSYGGTRDADEELAIVRGTWSARRGRSLLELVADEDGAVVGHLQAAPGPLDGRASAVAGVAPVCVAPALQRLGIGSTLMGALVRTAEELHWPLLVLLGDPAYYERFGFEAAGPLGLSYPPVGAGNPHFQARRLPGYDGALLRGEFGYCWE
jgi:putative acetyltransferase